MSSINIRIQYKKLKYNCKDYFKYNSNSVGQKFLPIYFFSFLTNVKHKKKLILWILWKLNLSSNMIVFCVLQSAKHITTNKYIEIF